jgi:hypothetical protein
MERMNRTLEIIFGGTRFDFRELPMQLRHALSK